MMSFIRGILVMVVALALPALPVSAHAQTYPAKPIIIIVSLAAGTGMDALVRVYGEKLSQSHGNPVVIENKPGRTGTGPIEAMKSAKDCV
jgi:tripartite-type tricarboxylate transporter receptor subunit TctC